MKKLVKLAAIAALFVCATSASAQWTAGVNVGAGLPMGDFGDFCKTGFGAAASGNYALAENMSVGLGIGYSEFTGKDDDKGKFDLIPITGNFSYFFGTEGLKPYAGLDLGLFLWETKYDGTKIDNGSYLGFAPVVGVQYPISDVLSIDGNIKYNYVMSKKDDMGVDGLSYLGINLGVIYSLGK